MSSVISPSQVIRLLFPHVKDRLINVLVRFELQKQESITSPKTSTFKMEHFPRLYVGYKEAVDTIIEHGKNCVDETIEVMKSFLPIYSNNAEFEAMTKMSSVYQDYKVIFESFFVLFFTDVTSQLLSFSSKTSHAQFLIDLGISQLYKSPTGQDAALIKQIILQYSVTFSFLSVDYLEKLLDYFAKPSENADVGNLLLLFRFLRLGGSKMGSVTNLENHLQRCYDIGQKYIKVDEVMVSWSQSLCALTAQINPEGLENVQNILRRIKEIALKKYKSSSADASHGILATLIEIRDPAGSPAKLFKKFVVEKAEKSYRAEASLKIFLAFLRGRSFSRSQSFWEWGSHNAAALPGVQASLIGEPDQDQSKEGSFTYYFNTVNFTDAYPDLMAQVIVNLAARDFQYFTRETVNKILYSKKYISALARAIPAILDPREIFLSWAAENPRNTNPGAEVDNLISKVKQPILSLLDQLSPFSKTLTRAYLFEISSSPLPPVFELPLSGGATSSVMRNRIIECTDRALSLGETADSSNFTLALPQVYSLTDTEYSALRTLEALPYVLDDGIPENIPSKLVGLVLSENWAVSIAAGKVIGCLYSREKSARHPLLEAILKELVSSSNPGQIFMLAQLGSRLFDLAMDPGSREIASMVESACLIGLTSPHAEVRDIVAGLWERAVRFASEQCIGVSLDAPGNEISMLALKRAGHIGGTLLTFREAASAACYNLFKNYLIEASVLVASKKHAIYDNAVNWLTKASPEMKPGVLAVFVNSAPYLSPNEVNNLTKYFPEVDCTFSEINKARRDSIIQYLQDPSLLKEGLLAPTLSAAHWTLLSGCLMSLIPEFEDGLSKKLGKGNLGDHAVKCLLASVSSLHISKAIAANPSLPELFISAAKSWMSIILKMKLNESKPFTTETKEKITKKYGDIETAFVSDFCSYLTHFLDSLRFKPPSQSQGPVFYPVLSEIIQTPIYSAFSRDTLAFLSNLVTIPFLSNVAGQAIAAFARLYVTYNNTFPYSETRGDELLKAESMGVPSLHFALMHQFGTLYRQYLDTCYESRSEKSSYFFRAFCRLFFADIPLISEVPELPDDDSLIVDIGKNIPLPDETSHIVREGKLLPEELILNQAIYRHVGSLAGLALVYTSRPFPGERSLAIRLLSRLLPIAAVTNPDLESDVKQAVKKLVGPVRPAEAAAIVGIAVPSLVEPALKEVLRAISLSPAIPLIEIATSLSDNLDHPPSQATLNTALSLKIPTPVSLWQSLTKPFSVPAIVSFLLSTQNQTTARSILVSLAVGNQGPIVSALAMNLSYPNWFSETLEGNMTNDTPPNPAVFPGAKIALGALAECARKPLSEVFSQLPTILVYALINSDIYPREVGNLLDAIAPSIGCHVTWESSTEARVGVKLPIYAPDFFESVLRLFESNKKMRLAKKLPPICMAWAVGCGNLTLAGRAALLYARVGKPKSGGELIPLVRSVCTVARCPRDKDGEFYIQSCLHTLYIMLRTKSKHFDTESISTIYSLSRPLLAAIETPIIAQRALVVTTVAVLLKMNSTENIREFMSHLADLSVVFPSSSTINGAFLSMFSNGLVDKWQADQTLASLIQASFIIFLTRLYAAYAAYHNMEPYSSIMSDDSIKQVFQAAQIMANGDALPEELSAYLKKTLLNPQVDDPAMFARGCGAILVRDSWAAVVESSPYLVRMAENTDMSVKRSVLTIVRSFVEVGEPSVFSDIIKISASIMCEDSSVIIQRFLETAMNRKDEVIEKKELIRIAHDWTSVSASIPPLDEGVGKTCDSYFTEPTPMIPLKPSMWAYSHVEKIRQDMKNLSVSAIQTRKKELSAAWTKPEETMIRIPSDIKEWIF